MRANRSLPNSPLSGFSLIEMMVAIAILMVILTAIFEIVDKTRATFNYSQSKVAQFRTARSAFQTMTRRISQAVLNTYWDYDDPEDPLQYQKQSELHFVVGPSGSPLGDFPELLGGGETRPGHAIFFQGPFNYSADRDNRNFDTLLNSWGYYIEFGSDEKFLPPFMRGREGISERYRFRLMEFRPPTEKMLVYGEELKKQPPGFDFYQWFKSLADDYSRPIAENVIALIISPRRSRNDTPIDEVNDLPWDIAPDYYYNSREFQRSSESNEPRFQVSKHQLPSLLHITLITIDDRSAIKLEEEFGQNVPDLQFDSLFQNASRYEADLETLENRLLELNLTYQVFTDTVAMRAAKWTNLMER